MPRIPAVLVAALWTLAAANAAVAQTREPDPARNARARSQPPAAEPESAAGATGFIASNVGRAVLRTKARRAAKRRSASPGIVAAPRTDLVKTGPAPPEAPSRAAAPSSARIGRERQRAPVSDPPRRPRLPVEDDPYEPAGMRTGGLVLRPALEVKGGYDTNPGRAATPRESRLWTIAPELALRSDWQRHELRADIRGAFTDYDSLHEANARSFDAKVNGRIDVTRDTRLDLEGRSRTVTANPNNLDLPAGLARLPRQTTDGATAGVAHNFNRLELATKGSVDRITWSPSRLTDGTSLSNKDRFYDQYGGLLRASYEFTPGVKPFVEAGLDTRRHDLEFDTQGIARDSNGAYVKAGTSFELTRKLTGEIAVGRMARTYADPALPDLRGLLTDASLVWTASALTTVKLTARTTVEETILRGVSGMLVREGEIAVDHAFRRWLIGTVKAGYGADRYVGSGLEYERFWAALGFTYKVSRDLQFKGEVRRERREANIPFSDYTSTAIVGGIRLQR